MTQAYSPKFVMLAVLDGWGEAADSPGNAISLANTINLNRFMASYPHTQLVAFGEAVGLPKGEPGNTETGHLNLGAGRIVYQDLARINMSIADGSFYQNLVFSQTIDHAVKFNSNLHLMGLIGAGGVHSNMEHLYALIDLCKRKNFERVFLHIFTDGRDSPQTSAKTYIAGLKEVLIKNGVGKIASIMGRYWAMDRDLRWERTAKAYFALTRGEGNKVKTPEEAVDASYAVGKTDEFIEPSVIEPFTPIKENDSVIFFNFRIDRPRQLTSAFLFKDFGSAQINWGFDPYLVKYEKTHITTHSPQEVKPFERGTALSNLCFTIMTQYSQSIVDAGANVAFPPEIVAMPIGRVLSEAGVGQLRGAESEKERFVTFYFNGQKEEPFPGEERLIVPSPKVSTYDLKPEMSAVELTNELLLKLRESSNYKFILINFANPDMVGHTGSIGATTKACEVVDDCLGKLYNWVMAYDGALIITADHGNAEEMINTKTGEIDTEHNANPVPFVVLSKNLLGKPESLQSGILADVAPTILAMLNIGIPSSMTGRNLLGGIWNK